MGVVTIRGCLICGGSITGNNHIGYLCGHCNIIFPLAPRTPSRRRELINVFTEYVKSTEGSTYHVPGCKYARRIKEPIAVSDEALDSLNPCKCTMRNP